MDTKQVLAVVVIFLFISVALAPSIHANTPPVLEGELVEITTEVCGLPGMKPQTIQLTEEDTVAVDRLFDEIKIKLNNAETREETEEIFNEAIIELDRYGLLGGLSVEQAQQIVIVIYQNHKLLEFLKTLYERNKEAIDENINLLCFIAGTTNETNFDSQLELLCGRISVLLSFIGPIIFFNKFPLYMFFILGYFLIDIFNIFNPMAIASRINLGGEKGGGWHPEFVDFYAHGWIVTTGLLGRQSYEGKMQGALPLYGSFTISEGYFYRFNPGVLGFTGLHIYNPIQSKHLYLGSSLWVKIERIE
jgi:hypothetical protein